MNIPKFYKCVALLLACLIFFITTVDLQAQQPPPPPPPQEWVLVVCVLVGAGIVLAIGGCAAKKLLNKKPRTFPDDDDNEPPPPPPVSTNSPAGPVTNSPPKKKLSASIMPAAGAAFTATGTEPSETYAIVKWDIQDTPAWKNDTNAYRNTVTGSRYTHIITATIQGSTDGHSWSVVGSRMIWWSDQDQTMLINYNDPHGAVVATRYVPRQELAQGPQESDSMVPLEPWEIGDDPMRFYRLASPVDRIGVLTE